MCSFLSTNGICVSVQVGVKAATVPCSNHNQVQRKGHTLQEYGRAIVPPGGLMEIANAAGSFAVSKRFTINNATFDKALELSAGLHVPVTVCCMFANGLLEIRSNVEIPRRHLTCYMTNLQV